MDSGKLNNEVTAFLDGLNHPLRAEIELLRQIIKSAADGLTENIKWNGPNYSFNGEDRITMRVQTVKAIQLIFHRGAKKLAQPAGKLIDDTSGLLAWKENDRAVATFKNVGEIEKCQFDLTRIINDWIEVTNGE